MMNSRRRSGWWCNRIRDRFTAGTKTRLRLEFLESRLTPASTHFAVIGDYGTGLQPEADVSALIHGWSPDYVLTVGDNNYENGSAATIDSNIGQDYHDYISNYVGGFGAGSPTNRFFPTLGNHDWITRSGTPALPTPYLDYFTLPGNERYYTFTAGPVQFFALDSGDGSGTTSDGFEPDGLASTSVQGQWLQSQLASSTAAWKIVYFHHAPYSSGDSRGTAIMRWPFQAWGATAVLAGHDHGYERLDVGGFPYFVDGLGGASRESFSGTPAAGSQVRYSADWGAMRVDASDTTIQFQFVTRTGTVVDTYTISVPNGLPTVSVAATDATAAEPGANTGTYTVSRTGSTATDLTVTLHVGGTATAGQDYVALPTTVTIPAGSASATVQLTPLDDLAPEPSETVVLSVAASPSYNVGLTDTTTVTILDDDSVSVPLIPTGAAWKYLDNGTDQGISWRAPGFNDSAWSTGNAELGYGDGDETTVVGYGPDPNNKYITTYFRKTFNVADASAVLGLQLRLLVDDGAVVYLNGVEVLRRNMSSGVITSSSLAVVALGPGPESEFVQSNLGTSALVTGTNVLAVEAHQASPDSSDVSFNLELTSSVVPVPTVTAVRVNDGNPQRSEVRSLAVTFSRQVSFANNNPAAAFVLTRVTGAGGVVGLNAAVSASAIGQTVVTLTFTGTTATDPFSAMNGGQLSLGDGRFQLSILDGSVTGAGGALDGDGNGTAGGTYQSPADTAAGGPGQPRLFRLFGDADGNGMVDLLDLAQFRSTFNADIGDAAYLDYLDADHNGMIDLLDLSQFRSRFNVTVF